MKSIEEKAKRYDEALERAKEVNDEHKAQPFDVMLKVFPELKESEDEIVRKELIDFVKSRLAGFPDCKRFTDWLEKQSEQKEATCVAEIIDHLTEKEQEILFKELEMQKVQFAWNGEDKETLQTIINDLSEELNEEEDKEEQEILSGKISFLQSLKPRPIHKWSREDNRTRLEISDFLECQKMEEPTRVGILNKWIAWIANLEPQWKQNPAWSEEDEKVIHCLEYTVRHFYEDEDTIKWCCDWLKSLRTGRRAVEERT